MTAVGAAGLTAASGCSALKLKQTQNQSKDLDPSLRKVEVARLIQAVDGNIIALKDDLNRILTILIGSFEANAIALGLGGKTPIRPMTHDLMQNILELSDIKVLRAVVTEAKNDAYFAKLHLAISDRKFEIDCRPSDAIALSVRTKAPIYVSESVMSEKSHNQTPPTLG